MLMSDAVRESLAPYYKDYLELAEAGGKLPSNKQFRLLEFLISLRGEG